MLLEEVKRNCKIIMNKAKQGEELYFDKKPNYEILKVLKQNGYKWHNQKKCWYRKINYIKENKQKRNYLNVKVGDIFHYSWGYEQTNANYFQVVSLKGTKQVIIREISYEVTETIGFESFKVKPSKNIFLEKSQFIEDNSKGAIKLVKGLQDVTIYINIDSFGFCRLWNGKEDIMTSYY